jgi:TldD protein
VSISDSSGGSEARNDVGSELIDADVAARVLTRALAHGGRFAEVFAERRHGLSMSIDESRLEAVQSGAEEGAGVRVVEGGTTYFAHVDGLDPADLERAADEAAAALRGERRQPRALAAVASAPLAIEHRPEEVPAERKAALLRELDERARGEGGEIAQFTSSYAEARRQVTVANSDGLFSGDDRTRVRIGAQAVARRDGAVETGAETLGAHRGFELLEDDPGQIAEQAARKALTLLDAGPAPSGSMPVVVGGGFGGVLFHEMTGHGLEADHIQKGASVYVGKLGEQVAQPLLNAYDDGRLPHEWGSDAIDDEGAPTQKTQVIEEGRLSAYLYDHLTAERDGVASTGNGRRESFRHLPIPRMTNTYIAPGDASPEAIIAEVEKGFYAVSFAGGQVDPATGDFVFGVSEGYLIEGGKVTRPCRGATLIGNCLGALMGIDAVGDDFFMKTGICGKGGQKAPVGTGQGHVRVRAMTVGGTEL